MPLWGILRRHTCTSLSTSAPNSSPVWCSYYRAGFGPRWMKVLNQKVMPQLGSQHGPCALFILSSKECLNNHPSFREISARKEREKKLLPPPPPSSSWFARKKLHHKKERVTMVDAGAPPSPLFPLFTVSDASRVSPLASLFVVRLFSDCNSDF